MGSTVAGKNTVGRPAGRDSERVRSDLLDAARKHFLKNEFKAVSLRQIAESAGVNPAMVNYYFGNKQGLYMAMVEALLSQLETSLEVLGEKKSLSIADFSRSYSKILVENPWWPNFMIREVLFSEGKTRDAVMHRVATDFAPRLLASIQQDIAAGNYRQDLNPAMTVVSMMALTIFPFLTKPMLESTLQVKLDMEFAQALAEHNIALFQHGVENTGDDGGES